MGYILAIPLLPAAAFAILAPLSRRLRNGAIGVSVGAASFSFVLSVLAFFATWPGGHEGEAVYHVFAPIAHVGNTVLGVGLLLDPVSAAMLIVVTLVGLCVQVYSIGYMHRDERIGWYYAVLSLFTAAMLTLVLSDNFLQLYAAWEVMGLCSYLLIGFWHEQEAPRKASMKAFLTTRVGDIGFAVGLLVMFNVAGTFDYAVVLHGMHWAPQAATAVALLLLFGAMGKSAQFPLHVWLPDAMAGPTPASALIHAATMVAAGVYLVARALPIFEASGVALTVTLIIGSITALIGGLLAAVQHDIKKVLAYSTISQLGYMFVALGAGGLVAGMFHLVTHAFFKSLLFLGAGVIIHAAHTQDMREMGGLGKHLKVTTVTFTIGSLALAGVFPFSGFWSKDEILTVLLHEGQFVALGISLLAAFVTAYYVARLWFRVFTGPQQTYDLHEAHTEMLVPMGVLAAVTALIGFSSPAFAGFLGHEGEWPAIGMALTSTVVAGSGLLLGWFMYGRRTKVVNTRAIKQRAGYVYGALVNKLYLDLTYEHFIIRPYGRFAAWLGRFDGRVIDGIVNSVGRAWQALSLIGWRFDNGVVDGAVNGVGRLVRVVGDRARTLQVGRVQAYQGLVAGVLVALMLWIVVKGV
jgi:NADH-quinone oxidoreductase subunit L